MIEGQVVPSRYEDNNHTLHAVVDHIIQDSLSQQVEAENIADVATCVSAHAHEVPGGVREGVCSEVLVVCGTLYAMPHVRKSLGIDEPKYVLLA